ncbi:hypothetical protein [Pseudomaricurvus hydrocarbonicus]|uniref:hypothetical protein n=1 Tax=Pseudomaricurvus hydrocarbonicus TaxID=1470433 RepID=UPI001AA02F8B|nr:hypothetical protein [Aestuariicella hydrocarbonica]
MKSVFLLQNQHKRLLNKQGEWVDGREANTLYRSVHRDEALNQMIEVNSRDYTLRIKVLECELNDRGVPLLKDEDMPPLGEASTTLDAVADDSADVLAVEDSEPASAEVQVDVAGDEAAQTTPDATAVELEAAVDAGDDAELETADNHEPGAGSEADEKLSASLF